MPEPTWSVIRDRTGEFHSAEYRTMMLDVSRRHAQHTVRGVVFSADDEVVTVIERFSASCTIEQAKARCVRVADRHAADAEAEVTW